MKIVILATFFVFCVSAFPADEQYKTQYEDMDIDEILHSKRLLKNYVDCLLDKGGCPPPARELKGLYVGLYWVFFDELHFHMYFLGISSKQKFFCNLGKYFLL